MRINLVMGFFLPIPPIAGGSTEKSWFGLAREFARCGHAVTVLSRQWPGWPLEETIDGVRVRRLRGYEHHRALFVNLWRDFRWSFRVWRALPPADITIVNCLALPAWLGWMPRGSGSVVVMPGRMPKGQYRVYRRIARVLAVSESSRAAVLRENPALAPVTRIVGYPITWSLLAQPRHPSPDQPVVLGFIGRLHREKGLDLLVQAVAQLVARRDLPPWRVLLCGPADVARGGSGDAYAVELQGKLGALLPPDCHAVRPPVFDSNALAALYREIDIFCYPSLALHGETFGVSVAEAMAAGAVPVVSRLACFTDLIRRGVNGEDFDHTAPDAAAQLAEVLAGLIRNPARRAELARTAQADSRRFDFPAFAERLLQDFSTLK